MAKTSAIAVLFLMAALPALAEQDRAPSIVTGDIKAGIEKHIEYLATLAPQSHFACVDMASSDGEFYDIDFFLEGDPGAMTVTETTVHKLNGRPQGLPGN